MATFKLKSNFIPAGDQPAAIAKIVEGYKKYPQQTLLGVTGSGKTFTVANVITKLNKPTLVLSHNKTLAAQLYNELKGLFPENKVCYFISYYDYYQPESYIPESDTYIEKEVLVNKRIEEFRFDAMTALSTRSDVIVVASVSCIYALGNPKNFASTVLNLKTGQKINRQDLIRELVTLLYERNDIELVSGRFRVRGEVIDVVQGNGEVFRLEMLGDEIEKLSKRDPVTGKEITALKELMIFPANPFVNTLDERRRAIRLIQDELKDTLPKLGMIEAHRLETRTMHDIEMIEQIGYCKSIENYSRHFDGRKPGEPPYCLLDYFPKDFIMVIDESHVTLPQVGGMYEGDKTRKKNLIDNGFRLPSAYDNRPLKFTEFEKYLKHVIYTTATPADYELKHSGQVIEQIIRPTGLIDPTITVLPSEGQIERLVKEIKETIGRKNRVLVTTLTKRLSEELSDYLAQQGIKVRYLHSEIESLERTEIIRDLRLGKFDCLVGINLLREGLDIPEVELVAILDADKEGFLRNTRSLIQTIGRAARNSQGRVLMFADKMTDSLKRAINETERRRKIQLAYNAKHGITPKTIVKEIPQGIRIEGKREIKIRNEADLAQTLVEMETEMQIAAEKLDFERAIELRDEVDQLKRKFDPQNKVTSN